MVVYFNPGDASGIGQTPRSSIKSSMRMAAFLDSSSAMSLKFMIHILSFCIKKTHSDTLTTNTSLKHCGKRGIVHDEQYPFLSQYFQLFLMIKH